MLKTLKIFSSKPSYAPVLGPDAIPVSSPVVGPSGGFFPWQRPGTTCTGPAARRQHSSNLIPSYSPSTRGY